jgi:undecaprenyl-diphosphatase
VQKLLHAKNLPPRERLNPDRFFLLTLTKQRKDIITRTAILFTKIGNGQLWLFFATLVFLYHVPTGYVFLLAILIQLYAQIAVKHLFKRARPYMIYTDLDSLYSPPDPYSFPSGHTCAAFTMAFVSKIAIPMLWPYFLVIALVIAFSRIYLAVHYPSDVLAGVVIAYISTKISVLITPFITGLPL